MLGFDAQGTCPPALLDRSVDSVQNSMALRSFSVFLVIRFFIHFASSPDIPSSPPFLGFAIDRDDMKGC